MCRLHDDGFFLSILLTPYPFHYVIIIPMTLIAYKYLLKPNATQREQCRQHFGHNRFVYNWGLALKQRYYRRYGQSLSKRRLQDQLVKKKRQNRFSWLKDVNSQSLLFTLLQLDLAFSRFFSKQAQFPRFKSKYSSQQAFSCPQHGAVDFSKSQIKLPKLGWVKAILHRRFEGDVKTVTVKLLPSGKYMATVLVENNLSHPVKSVIEANKTIGIDLGVKSILVTSDGEEVMNPRCIQVIEKLLAKHQRILARKKKGSKSRSVQKRVVAKLYERASNKRNDFLHQITHLLADKSHATSLVIENLNVKAMTKDSKFAKHISDVAMGQFRSFLAYKAERNGKNLLVIGRFEPSSKTCSCCGHIKNMTLADRVYHCDHCNEVIDRDLNAAINIRQIGLDNELEPTGMVGTVKCSSNASPIQLGALAKGYIKRYIRSVEAPTIAALAV